MIDSEKIKRARAVIDAAVNTHGYYEPKLHLYVLGVPGEMDDLMDENEDILYYCEDCIGKVEENAGDGVTGMEKLDTFDRFVECRECGEIIATGLEIGDSELTYWLYEADRGLYRYPKSLYMLKEILDQYSQCGVDDSINDLIVELAEKIIKEGI